MTSHSSSHRNSRHSDPKTSAELFKHFLYKDPDFLMPAQQFNAWFVEALTPEHRIVLDLTTDKANPLKVQLEQTLGRCKGVGIIETTAQKFEVSEYVVEYGFAKYTEFRGASKERQPMIFSARSKTIAVTENELVIKLFPNTRLADIEELWPIVERMQKELVGYTPNLQTTANYELIYAIYKQRLRRPETGKRTTFPEIFRLYQDGGLPGYSGSTTQYMSAHSLAAKYRQFAPKANEM